MNALSRCALAAVSLFALGACAGGPAWPWRHGTVVALVRSDAVPAGTDLQCMASMAPGATPIVAVVRLRVGRTPYDEAFIVPATVTLQVGEAVRVRLDTCAIRAATLASAAG